MREHSGDWARLPSAITRSRKSIRELVKRSVCGERSPRGYLRLGGPGVCERSALPAQETMRAFGDRRLLLVLSARDPVGARPDIYLWRRLAFDLTRPRPGVPRGLRWPPLRERRKTRVSPNTVNSQLDNRLRQGRRGKQGRARAAAPIAGMIASRRRQAKELPPSGTLARAPAPRRAHAPARPHDLEDTSWRPSVGKSDMKARISAR